MKRKIAIGVVVLLVIVMFSGAVFYALASPGSESDPFITLGFLNDVFGPSMMENITRAESDLSESFDSRITELESQLQAAIDSSSAMPGEADVFTVVTLSRGQTVTCLVGTEIMLRIGTATGTGSEPALVNYTKGETLSAGAALTANHMYLVTIEGNGVRATADLVRVLIRGHYTIS